MMAPNQREERNLVLRGRAVCFFDESKRARGRVKHDILKRYLQAWVPKLAYHFNTARQIIYVDGFAGAGKYTDSNGATELGSPLVAYQTVLEHSQLQHLQPRIVMIFIEKDQRKANELKMNLSQMPTSEKVLWFVVCTTFVEYMPKVLKITGNDPMFVFADPFGYSGVNMPMNLMEDLAHRYATDLLINVMDSFAIQYGVSQERNAPLVSELFGTDDPDEWKVFLCEEGLSPDEKRERFMNLYKKQLMRRGKLHFLQFGIRRGNNTHVYHLLFVTKHQSGIKSMKYAMWKESQESHKLIFSEYIENKGIMVDLPRRQLEITAAVIDLVKKEFEGRKVTGKEIADFILLETLYEVKIMPLKRGLVKRIVHKHRRFDECIYQF